MCAMSRASEIANNVWLGHTPDSSVLCPDQNEMEELPQFDILVEASDLARPPDAKALRNVTKLSASSQQNIEFPSSGSIMPPTWSHAEVDSLLDMCHWMYKLANSEMTPESSDGEQGSEQDSDGDIRMKILHPRPRRILIHCTDGYTESTLLALSYFMFAECIPVHEAWVRLHCEKQRNFFAYPSDVNLLTSIQPRLMQESPRSKVDIPSSLPEEPAWLRRIDGSLPSRILPYMYLGNLGHANNPGLLNELGIKRILSVGEPVSWAPEYLDSWGAENRMFVDKVQDNGVDPLTEEFDRCLEFLGEALPSRGLIFC